LQEKSIHSAKDMAKIIDSEVETDCYNGSGSGGTNNIYRTTVIFYNPFNNIHTNTCSTSFCCIKRVKIFSSVSAGMPTPLSLTVIFAFAPSFFMLISMLPPF
jgi:hypothetical protein